MPELPEVQTVVNQLGRKVTGRKILGFWTDWPKKVLMPVKKFEKQIRGATILGTRRFGKTIVVDLDNAYSLVIHLKMTGHLLVKTPESRTSKAFTEDPINGFIHHIFRLDHGTTIEFSDMRKFGWIDLVTTKGVARHVHIEKLGMDALAKELTLQRFETLLGSARKRPIGIFLLDQNKIAGIGNIYRSEALFRAGILPTRRGQSLSKKEIKGLRASIGAVLREALRLRGTSDGDFRDTAGQPGAFQRTLFVYGRAGQPCKRCGTIIVREKLGQRSVFFCPHCQTKKSSRIV